MLLSQACERQLSCRLPCLSFSPTAAGCVFATPTQSTHLEPRFWGGLTEGGELFAHWQEDRVTKIIWRGFRVSFESKALMHAYKSGACCENPIYFQMGSWVLGMLQSHSLRT